MGSEVKISSLPEVSSALSADIFPVVQSGVTYKESTTQLTTLLGNTFVQTTGGVTSGHLSVYGANGQIIKDCGVNVDTSQNIYPNNSILGLTPIVTAAGTTILTLASTNTQIFTGTTTQTVQLPVASTLQQGHPFYIINNSTGVVTVTSSGGNTVLTLPGNSAGYATCILTFGTTAASWYGDATGAGTDLLPNGTVLVTSSTQTIVNGTSYVTDAAGVVTLTLPGVVVGSYFELDGINGWVLNIPNGITATIGNVTLVGGGGVSWSSGSGSDTVLFKWIGANILQAVSWTGLPFTTPGNSTPLPIIAGSNISITKSGANMSIGLNVSYSTNQLIYASGSTTLAGLATANSGVLTTSTGGVPSILAAPSDTRGHALLGRAAAGMSFSTAYYPNSGTLTGQMISYDGTGYGNSTSTYADTYTINNLLFASGTNTVTGLATANSSVLVTSGGGVPSLSTTLPSGLAATSLTLTTPVLGTPTSGTLTSCTGLPVSTGISGLGTGIATALATNVNGSGAISLTTSPTFVTPILGTPASGNLSNTTNLPIGKTFSAGLNSGNVTSSTPLMCGFAVTHAASGTSAMVTFCGQVAGAVAGNTNVGVRYGTGSAPAQGAGVTGTAVGTITAVNQIGTAVTVGYSKTVIITGLTPATTYWFDMQLAQNGGSGVTSLANTDCSVLSF